MKIFWRFAATSTILTYILIFIGGLVRVSGAGLGCPDWPKCFGRWIPPTDISQLPPEFDPNLFNFALAWIEYINRLFGVLVGLSILAMAIVAFIKIRDNKRLLFLSIFSVFLVAFQGWQGSRVVSSALEEYVISIHLFLALFLFAVLLFITQNAFYLKENYKRVHPQKNIYYAGIGLIVFTLVQILSGTQIRSELKNLVNLFPDSLILDLVDKLGFILNLHTFLGILFVFATAVFGLLFIKSKNSLKNLVFVVAVGSVLQIILGFVMTNAYIQPIMQVIHLWISTFIFGLLLIMTFSFKYEKSYVKN